MRTVQDDVPGGRGVDMLHVLVLAPGFVDLRKFAFKKNLTVRERPLRRPERLATGANTPRFQTTSTPPEELPEDKTLAAARA